MSDWKRESRVKMGRVGDIAPTLPYGRRHQCSHIIGNEKICRTVQSLFSPAFRARENEAANGIR
jgi:hypothetical protein